MKANQAVFPIKTMARGLGVSRGRLLRLGTSPLVRAG